MSKRSVFCIAPSRGRADRIVHELKEAAFPKTDLSVLFLDRSAAVGNARVLSSPAAAAASAAPFNCEIRGVLSWIDGIRSLSIPGVGPLIAAGPIAAALSVTTVGGIAGGLIDFDVPTVEARRFEARIADGQILIAVHTENPEMSDQARAIFTANEAEAICTMIDVFTPGFPFKSLPKPTRESVA